MKHRPFRPPHQRRIQRFFSHDPRVVLGPMFLAPSRGCGEWKPEGPRERIFGRWVSAIRASRLRYVSRTNLRRNSPRADPRQRKRWAIGEWLGGDRACPF